MISNIHRNFKKNNGACKDMQLLNTIRIGVDKILKKQE